MAGNSGDRGRGDSQLCGRPLQPGWKLMEYGSLEMKTGPQARVEIRRGMQVSDCRGQFAGQVAGVLVDAGGLVACVILSHLPADNAYQSLPAAWVRRIEEGLVLLAVETAVLCALPAWHAAE